jgi:D-methionine transport system ATP-binding protein
MITIMNLRKIYGEGEQAVAALNDVSLKVQQGEIFGVLGQSGAGKSTLIRCVNLLERPTSGAIVIDGEEITALRGVALRKARQRIGMIFQHFHLLSSRTVAENVAFPLEVIGYKRKARKARVRELLSLVGLEDKANAYPAQLSGGQKQRVGIARALVGEPAILLSDEATSALDPQTTGSILELLQDLNRRMGVTILLITHEMNVVRQICHSVGILEEGRLVEQGLVSELAAQPDSHLAQALFPQQPDVQPRPGATIATMTFSGPSADLPIITMLIRDFALEVNILSANVEVLGDQRIGHVQTELSGERIADGLAYVRSRGVHVEVQK